MKKYSPAHRCCGSATPLAPAATHCPVEATIALIGGKYKALILWKLTSGVLRFSQLRKDVPGATPKMLTQQLRELESDGLVKREVYPVIPPKVEYSLTELGGSIQPILQSMYDWGTGYLRGQGLEANCTMRPFPGGRNAEPCE
jgi:DNA-binding HxlR family transcriptional regulator